MSPATASATVLGPCADRGAEAEAILRSLPAWFGIEESLRAYVQDTARLPTFFVGPPPAGAGFLTLRQHFEAAWEVHCLGVTASARGAGLGSALLAHAEDWLRARGALLLQVKTVSASHPSAAYAETRAFYARRGFQPLEEFPTLWGPRMPVLQLVKAL